MPARSTWQLSPSEAGVGGVGPCSVRASDASRFVAFLAVLVANLHRARSRWSTRRSSSPNGMRRSTCSTPERDLRRTVFARGSSRANPGGDCRHGWRGTRRAARSRPCHGHAPGSHRDRLRSEDAVPVSVQDPRSDTARVSASSGAVIIEPLGDAPESEPYRQDRSCRCRFSDQPRTCVGPVSVVNLSGRRSGSPFTSGDEKLVSAIATQIGTAIQITGWCAVVAEASSGCSRNCSSPTTCR